MTLTQTQPCPSAAVLNNFLSGRLDSPVLEHFESHVAECPQCQETLRSLHPSDTLSEQVALAMQPDAEGDAALNAVLGDDVDAMIMRASSREFHDENRKKSLQDSSWNSNPMAAEMLADRAAEVLRCIDPPANDNPDSSDLDDSRSLGTLGDYRLLRLVGAGSTGVVFQALDLPLDRLVALKVLRPSLGPVSRERFLAEARLAASIEHANVVTIYQVGQTDQLAFIAMPWQPGETLEAKLARGESFDESLIRKWVSEIAGGLHAAHQRQLIHRDIKPANLWITQDDHEIRILDFGLARIDDQSPGLTATGMLAGTPNYMSPEQARGQELDGRSDLFSAGCVLYQLLTGRMPFGGPNILATLQSIVTHDPPPPCLTSTWSKLHNRDLSDVAMCLLEKQTDNRPQSAAQLQELLAQPRSRWPIAVAKYRQPPAAEDQKQPISGGNGRGNRGRWASLIAAGAIGWFAWMFAPQIFRIITDRGEVVVETNGENVEVRVLEDGNRIRVVDADGGASFDLDSGDYQIEAIDRGSQQPMNVQPTTIVMQRGGKQIVKVTQRQGPKADPRLRPSEKVIGQNSRRENVTSTPDSGRLVIDDMGVEITRRLNSTPTEPRYRGQTFDHWINVAKYDRDDKACADALKACVKTADDPAQQQQLIEVTRKLVRKFGTKELGNQDSIVLYHDAFMEVMQSLTPKQTYDFFMEELANGNRRSRDFFWAWAIRLTANKPVTSIPDATLKYFDERLPQVCAALDKSWPAERDIYMVAGILNTSLFNETDAIKSFAQSPLYERFKQHILKTGQVFNGNLPFITAGFFLNDPEVFSRYESLLFSTEANTYQRQAIWHTYMNLVTEFPSADIAKRLNGVSLKLIENAVGPGKKLLRFTMDDDPEGRKETIESALRRINAASEAMDEPQRIEIAAKLESLQQEVVRLEELYQTFKQDPFTDETSSVKKSAVAISTNISKVSLDMKWLIAKLRGETPPPIQDQNLFHPNRAGGGGLGDGMGGGGFGGGMF